jgi:class 3 adenylate cyclase
MPASVYDQLLENGYFSEDAEKTYLNDPLEPPMHLPVFVVTDVQDSTALWATAPEAMSEAQTLHDDLLRKELLRFRCYEITTCGDAFQLAFRNVTDAIGWCIDVQEKLMRLRWPMEITNQKNCGKVYNIWGKMIFNGLRVRMAIHDGDDQIIYSKHPMTGKMTYLGISEIVVREIVDLGDGGDILISDSALKRLQEEEPGEEFMQTFYCESFGLLERAELSVSFELHHLFLSSLGYRNDKERYKLEHLRSMRQLLSAVVQH